VLLAFSTERCQSGRMGRSRKPLSCKGPWVQIPPPPPSRTRPSTGRVRCIPRRMSWSSGVVSRTFGRLVPGCSRRSRSMRPRSGRCVESSNRTAGPTSESSSIDFAVRSHVARNSSSSCRPHHRARCGFRRGGQGERSNGCGVTDSRSTKPHRPTTPVCPSGEWTSHDLPEDVRRRRSERSNQQDTGRSLRWERPRRRRMPPRPPL
jgi:hypothetical protein